MLQVQLKCIQSLTSICQHSDRQIFSPFVHKVVLPIVNYLASVGKDSNGGTIDEPRLAVVIDGIRLMETMLTVAEEQHSEYLAFVL